jgi:predicted dehydrogenase
LTLNYAIIGTGSMGREHIECLKVIPKARVVALADSNAESLRNAAGLLDYPVQTFENYQDLLAAGGFDVLVIATPNHTHKAVLADAFKTDAHVLVEKPLCISDDECQAVVSAAKGRQGIVWVGQEYRYMPPVAELIRLVKAGEVGKVQQVSIKEHREPFYPKVDDWNRFSANTGGTLVEKCCHYFDLMNLLVGEVPVRVFASGGQRVNHLDESYQGKRPDILDSAYVIVEYPSGVRAMLDLCMFAEASKDREVITVIGDEGKVESFLPSMELRLGKRAEWGTKVTWDDELPGNRGVGVRHVYDPSVRYVGHHHGATYVEHLRLIDAIENQRAPEVSVNDGALAVAMGRAAHRSIETGKPEEVLLPA